MMQQVEVVVDGVSIETWVASEEAARALADEVLAAAETGTSTRLDVMEAIGQEMLLEATLVLRLGSAKAVSVRILPDTRTGAAMGLSR